MVITLKEHNSHAYIQSLAAGLKPALRWDGNTPIPEWQKAAREKLQELLGLPLTTCADEMTILAEKQCDGYTRRDFEFQSEPGYFVSASILVPDGINKPIPAAICIQGHSRGMHISLGEVKYPEDAQSIAGGRDFAVRAVKEGLCAVTLEQRYMGSAGHVEGGAPACRKNNEAMATLLLGRTAIGERVWDISRLIDVMTTHFADVIDAQRILCMGNSGGGTATFYAACMDQRIHMAVPSCSVCTYEDSIIAMDHCPCNFIPGIRKYFEMGDLGGLIAPRKLIVVCGIRDSIFPLDGVHKAYEDIRRFYTAVGKEDIITLVEGDGGHQFYPDDAWPVMHQFLEKE